MYFCGPVPHFCSRNGLPFDPRRKCRPAATAQAGVQHLLDDGFGRHGRSGPEALPAAMGLVVPQTQRIDDAHARKSQALLPCQIRHLLGQPMA
jgi:hypothetical protein